MATYFKKTINAIKAKIETKEIDLNKYAFVLYGYTWKDKEDDWERKICVVSCKDCGAVFDNLEDFIIHELDQGVF